MRPSAACRLAALGGWGVQPASGRSGGFPAAHSDLRVLGRCVFARPQVTTVALAQWEGPASVLKIEVVPHRFVDVGPGPAHRAADRRRLGVVSCLMPPRG
jgi:hypothetical protein